MVSNLELLKGSNGEAPNAAPQADTPVLGEEVVRNEASLANALKGAGANPAAVDETVSGLNPSEVEGITRELEAPADVVDGDGNVESYKSPDAAINSVRSNVRGGIFSSIGEFISEKFSSAWEKIKSLFGR